MKTWIVIVLLTLGLALMAYSVAFNHFQSQYLAIMSKDVVKDKPVNKFSSMEFILDKLSSVPLVDINKIDSLVSFNWGLAVISKSQTKSEKLLVKASQSSDSVLASNAHFNLGNMYVVLKQYKKALQEYELAIKKNPRNLEAKYNYELLIRLLKNKGKASGKKSGKGQKGKKGDVPIKIPGRGSGKGGEIGW